MNLLTLDGFSLALHGDRREQLFWPLMNREFSNYEVFWRRYIVPLTFRIDRSVSPASSKWIRIRPDVPRELERLAMRHYSVFYWTARAVHRITDEKGWKEFPEDVFVLLDSANDNVGLFREALLPIAKQSDTALPMLRAQFPKQHAPVFEVVRKYRDTMLHNPVLGRSCDAARETLPKVSDLDRVKDSWRAAELLGPKEFAGTTELILKVSQDYVHALQDLWGELLQALERSRFNEKYTKVLDLSRFEPISAPSSRAESVGVFQSTAASGTYCESSSPAQERDRGIKKAK